MKMNRTRALGLLVAAALALSACGGSDCTDTDSPVAATTTASSKGLTATECTAYLPAPVATPVTARELRLEGWTERPSAVYAQDVRYDLQEDNTLNHYSVWNTFLTVPGSDAAKPNAFTVQQECSRYLALNMLRAWTADVPGLVFYTKIPNGQPVNVASDTDPLALVELKLGAGRSVFVQGQQVRAEALHQPEAFASALAAAMAGVNRGTAVQLNLGPWGLPKAITLVTAS